MFVEKDACLPLKTLAQQANEHGTQKDERKVSDK